MNNLLVRASYSPRKPNTEIDKVTDVSIDAMADRKREVHMADHRAA
jgi:hypothetical protein